MIDYAHIAVGPQLRVDLPKALVELAHFARRIGDREPMRIASGAIHAGETLREPAQAPIVHRQLNLAFISPQVGMQGRGDRVMDFLFGGGIHRCRWRKASPLIEW